MVSKTKCRFCPDAKLMSASTLRCHVEKVHPAEMRRIHQSLPEMVRFDQLSRFDRSAGRAGINHEFRKRMGYNSRSGSTPIIPDDE